MPHQWEDPFSPRAQREVTSRILTGMNYRLFYEENTRQKLIETYRELSDLAKKYADNDDEWKASIRKLLEDKNEDKNLRNWLIGLTAKTASNLEIRKEDYPSFFDDVIKNIEDSQSNTMRETALLLWAGAATLTIRGSAKSKIGKTLEKSIARATLTVIGLDEERGDFRLNIGADEEVSRETDAEVKTPRGYTRIEVGMIGQGNSEVINDKVGRISRNDVILFDKLPARSTAWNTAEQRGIKLIQLRNNHPVEELRQHLQGLRVGVQSDSISTKEVEKRVMKMPLKAFDFSAGG